jgi:hypothetical protein
MLFLLFHWGWTWTHATLVKAGSVGSNHLFLVIYPVLNSIIYCCFVCFKLLCNRLKLLLFGIFILICQNIHNTWLDKSEIHGCLVDLLFSQSLSFLKKASLAWSKVSDKTIAFELFNVCPKCSNEAPRC